MKKPRKKQTKEYKRKYYYTNIDKIIKRRKQHYQDNKDIDKQFYRDNWKTITFTPGRQIKRGYAKLIPIKHSYVSVYEHIHVMKLHLGYWFSSKEYQVHHINGIRDDNRIENLKLIKNCKGEKNHRMIDELLKCQIENKKLKEEITLLKKENALSKNYVRI